MSADKAKALVQGDRGLTVYKNYGFEPSRRPQKRNPFRNERTPSLYILPEGYFKDFGADEIKGDVFTFVMLYEGVSFSQAKDRILSIYEGAMSVTHGGKKYSAGNKVKAEPVKSLSHIEFREFNPQELAYFGTKTGAVKELLERNRFQAVDEFCIQETRGELSTERHYPNQNFCFAIEIVKGKSYKLIQPKEALRCYGRSKTIFLPNLSPARDLVGDYAYSLGIQDLDPSRKVIICGGESDYLCLKAHGYNVFTLGSEGANIGSYVKRRLAQKGISLDQIYSLYDSDYAGIEGSHKLLRQHGIPKIRIEGMMYQKSQETGKPVCKDICDFYAHSPTFAQDVRSSIHRWAYLFGAQVKTSALRVTLDKLMLEGGKDSLFLAHYLSSKHETKSIAEGRLQGKLDLIQYQIRQIRKKKNNPFQEKILLIEKGEIEEILNQKNNE